MKINSPSIEEWELLSFFSSSHVSRSYGDDWFDSDSLYETVDSDGLKITFSILPIHLDIRVTLSKDTKTYYDWQACGVKDVQYIEEINQTKLVVLVNETDKCEIIVSPNIQIKQFSGTIAT